MRPSPSHDVLKTQKKEPRQLTKSSGQCLREFHDSMAVIFECAEVKPDLLASFGVSDELTQEAMQLEEDRAWDAKDRLKLKSETLKSAKNAKIEKLEKDLMELAENYDYIGTVVQTIFEKFASIKERLESGSNVSEEECSQVEEGVEICKMAVQLCKKLRDEFKKKINRLLAIDPSPKILANPKVKKATEHLY